MNLWCRLKHPNIVPFGNVVVDELEGHCVGFTSKYIPGGTLEENKNRAFKLKWLRQLTNVVDELNLHLGIAHQDVAARNLLIEESTDSIMRFDFDFSARVGCVGYSEDRNDIKGVVFTLFETINHHRRQPSARQAARRSRRCRGGVARMDTTSRRPPGPSGV